MYGDLKLSQTTLKAKSFAISSNWSFSSKDKVVSPVLFTDGLWICSFPGQGLLWLGSNSQTYLKAEIGDHAPPGRKKALTQCLSKSLLTFETYKKKSQRSLITPIILVWLCSHFICWLEHSCCSPLKWQIEFIEQVEYVTQISKLFDLFCVTEMCCQWWMFF